MVAVSIALISIVPAVPVVPVAVSALESTWALSVPRMELIGDGTATGEGKSAFEPDRDTDRRGRGGGVDAGVLGRGDASLPLVALADGTF